MLGFEILPVRFLFLISHLILTIFVLWARDGNIQMCLQPSTSYNNLNTQIIVATSISYGLFALELVSLIWMLSTVIPWVNVLSVLFHAAGTVTLFYYIFDSWCSTVYWFIFGFCCCPPAAIELWAWIVTLLVKKRT